MSYKLTALTVAIVAGLTAPALAERGFGGDGPRGAGMDQRPSFAELDANGDGALTIEEMDAHRQARFAKADADGNGELSIEELTAAANARMQGKIADRSARMMDQLDTDKNGTLSMAELEARGRGKGMDRMFNHLDADEDGSVTAEEFSAFKDHGPKKGGHGKWRDHRGGPAN